MASRQAIPSEQELALRFNVSQGTVRKAIDEMAGENMVVRKQGKGTFVASHNDPRALFRFLRLVPNDGDLSHPDSVPWNAGRPRPGMGVAHAWRRPRRPDHHHRAATEFSGVPVVVDEITCLARSSRASRSNCCRAGVAPVQSLRVPIRVAHDSRTGAIRAVAADRTTAEMLRVGESRRRFFRWSG